MGCCGSKESFGSSSSGGGNFKGQGRTLGDAPPRPVAAPASGTKASIPPPPPPAAPTRITSSPSPGRTLGAEGSAAAADARSAAAKAAEARATKPGSTDKLSQNLAAQKKAGMKGALEEAAEENRRLRENDAAAETRNWS